MKGIKAFEVGLVGLACALVAHVAILKWAERQGTMVCYRTRPDVERLETAICEFMMLYRRAPENLEELLVPDESGYRVLKLDRIPLDIWGRPYLYQPPTEEDSMPGVYSLGADGLPGGEGWDADVDSRDDDWTHRCLGRGTDARRVPGQ